MDEPLRRLRAIPGLVVSTAGADRIRLQAAGSAPKLLRLLELSWLRTAPDVDRASEMARPTGQVHTLISVTRLSPEVRHAAALRGLSWYERSTGVLRLQLPGIFVDSGPERGTLPRKPTRGVRVTKLAGLAGRCAESLVLHGLNGHLDASITTSTLAAMSDVTVPQAAHVLSRLERADLVERIATPTGRARAWIVKDAVRLLETWAAEERPAAEEIGLYVWARTPDELLSALRPLDNELDKWALGGAAAANLYAPTLLVRPTPVVWIPNDAAVESVSRALGARAEDASPNILIRRSTRDPWRTHTHRVETKLGRASVVLPLISRPRAYVECLQDSSGRTQELAAALARQLTPSAPI